MQTQPPADKTQAQNEQIIKQVVNFWKAQTKANNAIFAKHEDETYLNAVAPGRNTGIYLLAHLIATHDSLLPLFGLGELLFPELQVFAREAQSNITLTPTLADLRQKWETINTLLDKHFDEMTTEQWLERHMSVSEEDFKLDPLRNKLNVLLSRAGHQSYHRGQLIFLTQKELAGQ